jgi:hypothetical protein
LELEQACLPFCGLILLINSKEKPIIMIRPIGMLETMEFPHTSKNKKLSFLFNLDQKSKESTHIYD